MTHDPASPVTVPPLAPPASLEARLQVLEDQVRHLQAAAAQARALFQDSPGAALLLTVEGRLLDVNRQGAVLLGSTRELLQGRRLTLSLPPASQATLGLLLARVFGGQGRQTGELQVTTPAGKVLDVAVEAGLHGPDGESPTCHLTLTDVTAFKLAHRALWNTQQVQDRQLQERTLQVKQLQEEFENVVLVSGRELESGLTRAENFLTLSRQQAGPPDAMAHAQEALRQTQTLLSSLRQYMQVRFLRTRLRPVDLGRVLREVLKDVQHEVGSRNVQLSSDALPVVQGDSQALQIIMREYLCNALKFTRTRPQVRLHVLLRETDTEYHIGVEDNGVGFNMRQRQRAFELFGRLHPAGLYGGTGLGLAVVRRLCERFGGRAWGEGKLDHGATFWFAWPKSPPQE